MARAENPGGCNCESVFRRPKANGTCGTCGGWLPGERPTPFFDWERKIPAPGVGGGKHPRYECVSRPGEWCQGITSRTGRCTACPTRRHDAREEAPHVEQ